VKKTLLVILLLAATVAPSYAQLFMSGNIEYSNRSYSRSQGFDNTQPQGMALGVTVQMGYQFSETFKAGIQAGISNSRFTYTDGFYDRDALTWKQSITNDRTLMTAGGGLFMRIRCVDAGRLTFHMQLSGNYAYGIGASTVVEQRANEDMPNKTRTDFTRNTLEIKLVPVATFALSQHFGIDLYADLLSIAYRHDKQTNMLPIDLLVSSRSAGVDYTVSTSTIEAALKSQQASLLTVGLYYQF
jgi:hypothetical protein